MADFSIKVITEPTKKKLAQFARNTDKATAAGLRAAAGSVRTAARAAAPVYQGDRVDVPKGRLRSSIKSGRVGFKAMERTITVAPRGWRVRLYRAQEEAAAHYMQAGHAVVATEARAVFEAAWAKALR